MGKMKDRSWRRKALYDYNSSIGGVIARLRNDRHLEQTDIAERFGSPQSSVSKLENGERMLKFCEIDFLAQALDMTRDDLITELCKVFDKRED